MKWIGQNIYDQVSKFRNTVEFIDTVEFSNTVDFSKDVTFYQPINNADPTISLGASDDERLKIKINYQGSNSQIAQIAEFTTSTESGTAHDGRFHFRVDDTTILRIQDNGLKLEAGKGININDVDILTDNGAGVATLSNIDALDATTISTLNAALTAGDITGVTAGTGLSGGGTDGAVTLNVDAAQTQITSVGTIATGEWQATPIATAYIGDDQVTEDKLANTLLAEIDANTAKVTNSDQSKSDIDGLGITTVGTIDTGVWNGTAVASAYLDADTMHLGVAQTITNTKTFATTKKLQFRDANAYINSPDANDLEIAATDITLDAANVIELEANTNVTGNLITSGSVRGKQIQFMTANFKGGQGTTETFVPWGSTLEKTSLSQETTGMIMPCPGNVKEVIIRAHYATYTSENIVVKVYTRLANQRANGHGLVGDAVTIAAPTQAVGNANNVSSTGEITRAYAAGDMLGVSLTHQSTGPAAAADKTYVTVVVENDLNDLGY